jgi:hypothetical protein
MLLGAVPFVLYRYGEQLRKKSKTASALWAFEPGQDMRSASPVLSNSPEAAALPLGKTGSNPGLA